jgi:hypothetical protein
MSSSLNLSELTILIVRTGNGSVARIVQLPQEGAMYRHHLATVTGFAAGLAAIVLVPAAAAGGPQPVSPEQAQALLSAPALVLSGSSTRAVSPREALSAASLPGAVVSVAPGLSAAQAVGLGPTLTTTATTAGVLRPIQATPAATACSANSQWSEWGTWPYQQRITDTTYWCAVYGDHITYTSSSTNGSGTLCGTSWTSAQTIGGGIGYSWFVNRASAGFTCQTAIPWVSLHPSHYEDTSRNAWGSTSLVGTS